MQLINTGKRVKPNKNKIRTPVSSQYCQKRTCAACKDLTLFLLECFKSVCVSRAASPRPNEERSSLQDRASSPFSFCRCSCSLPGAKKPILVACPSRSCASCLCPRRSRYSMSSTSVRGMRAARRNSACTRGRKPGLPRQPCVFGSPTCRCWRVSRPRPRGRIER
uniref:Uncharacterized protein n=1 Tax=Laticauda laticaudata TaxID=8630 RepID=A0A8C5WRG1_LATLA